MHILIFVGCRVVNTIVIYNFSLLSQSKATAFIDGDKLNRRLIKCMNNNYIQLKE